MSTTTAYVCPAKQWTPVSTTSANVTVQCLAYSYLAAVGSTPPADFTTGLTITLGGNGGLFVASGLANTDVVYIAPTGDNQIKAQVIES